MTTTVNGAFPLCARRWLPLKAGHQERPVKT